MGADTINGMEWIGDAVKTVGIVIGAASGITGLVLGIRSEIRARYRGRWSIDRRGAQLIFINRTGNDAIRVKLRADGGRILGSDERSLIRPDEEVMVHVRPDSDDPRDVGRFFVKAVIAWEDPDSGRHYRWHEGKRKAVRLRQRKARRVGSTSSARSPRPVGSSSVVTGD